MLIFPRASRNVFFALLTTFLLTIAPDAKADFCTVSMSDMSFGNVSPVSGQDYYANGTLSVTCTFVILVGNIIVLPNINACASLGPGSGAADINTRVLMNGSKKIPFNLYRSASYTPANLWGGYETNNAIPVFFAGLLAIGTNTQVYPVYAKIAASSLALAAVESNATTTYSASFAGAGTMQYSSSSVVALPCQSAGSSVAFAFNVSANVMNDCLIDTTPVSFGSSGALSSATRATGAVLVKCTAANNYRITLNGGVVTNSASDRKMKNVDTGETVSYRLSTSLDGPIWGDGANGTTTYDSIGTGLTQQIIIYGLVPSQATPSPGTYSDQVTALIYF
ncbi:fimbrial major subunit CsuA/B family protein [Duganella sp. FT80W]|uniref:Fimbrial major subunit CsuA/B family protein n=1 Tax=Duganella guangzhouensis TaxID=2666084 RepID=A0A6I2L6J2_9BURK|nr:spore coat U domain-containing protein [Duganella guangzhouensis]MRW93262.1 fimbrial major subunit CsuA/B family protein [Duganella guangzhouensis]